MRLGVFVCEGERRREREKVRGRCTHLHIQIQKCESVCVGVLVCVCVCVRTCLWQRLVLPECICTEDSGYDRPVCCLPRIIAYGLPEASPTGDT